MVRKSSFVGLVVTCKRTKNDVVFPPERNSHLDVHLVFPDPVL